MRDTRQASTWLRAPDALRRDLDEFLKRAVDVAAACLGLALLSPLLLCLALIVRLDSPGPVLHRRRVLGRGGGEFDAYKFRSMAVDGDALLAAALAGRPDLRDELAREQKLRDDPRVTRCGRWMRRLSFDELPQLLNVLRGQMSVVGPRMISPPELAHYGPLAPELLTVKPGLTGLWQISGRSELGRAERVRLDIQYVRTRSTLLDLKLLLLTVPAVLTGKGAY